MAILLFDHKFKFGGSWKLLHVWCLLNPKFNSHFKNGGTDLFTVEGQIYLSNIFWAIRITFSVKGKVLHAWELVSVKVWYHIDFV